MKEIKIKGAKIHNLKNIDITIPKNKLIVATGVSGSGKSSLVFDIIFEQGRKQYLQSLGILSSVDGTDPFDQIEGLGPTIAVQQNTIRQSNPRSTIGTRTRILNMLSLVYGADGHSKEKNYENLNPSFFSYNSSSGMCLKCSGRGAYFEINRSALVPNDTITLEAVFKSAQITPGYMRVLERRFSTYFQVPFVSLPEEIKTEAIYGRYENKKVSFSLTKAFENRQRKGEDIDDMYRLATCSECHGYRVGEEARNVFIEDKHIGELCTMNITELQSFLETCRLRNNFSQFSRNLITDIISRLKNLQHAQLGYLNLYREMSSLSGGELQRLFLNGHLDSKMDSIIYVLDEPTAGLHISEKDNILDSIQQLKAIGNTVIVVEHDSNTITRAEHIIDMGPLAGSQGGEIIYQGELNGLLQYEQSITGKYISGALKMPKRTQNKDIEKQPQLIIHHAKTNNLKDITVAFPLGALVGIAGKSGSGKSSLLSDTLLPLLKNHFKYQNPLPAQNNKLSINQLEGANKLSGYAEISQAPIGKNSSSNPASYIGIWDKIRTLYANLEEAVDKDFMAGHFSFNSKGACSLCGGSGYEKIWLGQQLSINKICPTCHGKRFNEETLKIVYKQKNIHDVLELSVSKAIDFFEDQSSITAPLKILDQMGMGYIKLGQPTPTLSGGESQRIKLAKEIGKKRKGNTLYILDEPTTGLSQYDTAKLITLLNTLVEKGNSIIVIEHDLDVLRVCDYLIELGPAGGSEGGYLIACGTPKELKDHASSITGRYL